MYIWFKLKSNGTGTVSRVIYFMNSAADDKLDHKIPTKISIKILATSIWLLFSNDNIRYVA